MDTRDIAPTTCVSVDLWLGTANYAMAVADMFGDDILTITTMDGRIVAQHQPGSWKRAITFDERGYPLSDFIALTPTWPLPGRES